MGKQVPDLLTGTELCLVAEVPGAGDRWQQVHFNKDITRQFFNLEGGLNRPIALERVADDGVIVERAMRQLVMSETNQNAKIEFSFGSVKLYPEPPDRPIIVVVESAYLTYRYRTRMPNEPGYQGVKSLLSAGPSIGRGLRRRIVTLDELEHYWPESQLRGEV